MTGVSGADTATFVYDGDGKRVKGTVNGSTTTYLSDYFEWTGNTSTMKSYYYAGATRVAMRTGPSTLNYLLGDHLGSMSVATDSSGVKSAEQLYTAWGTARYASTPGFTTSFRFTGQRRENYLDLYWYGSRWYDASAARFIQPDTIIPQEQGVQAWDRYAYTNNNPVKYTDPSGHKMVCEPEDPNCNQEARHEAVSNIVKITPHLTSRPSQTPIPIATPQPTLTPLSPQQYMTQSAISESQSSIMAQPAQTVCPVPPGTNGLEPDEALALLRQVTGEIDPFEPSAFTGTSTGWIPIVESARDYISKVDPANPTIGPLDFVIDLAPTAAFGYNFIYDHVTNTGEYRDIPINFHTVSYITIVTSLFLAIP